MHPTPTLLTFYAAKYVWWKPPAQAIQMPQRVVAQVMNIGSYDDVLMLAEQVGDDYLRQVLHAAEIGQFNERSWAYWQYRLGLRPSAALPPMPQRQLG